MIFLTYTQFHLKIISYFGIFFLSSDGNTYTSLLSLFLIWIHNIIQNNILHLVHFKLIDFPDEWVNHITGDSHFLMFLRKDCLFLIFLRSHFYSAISPKRHTSKLKVSVTNYKQITFKILSLAPISSLSNKPMYPIFYLTSTFGYFKALPAQCTPNSIHDPNSTSCTWTSSPCSLSQDMTS